MTFPVVQGTGANIPAIIGLDHLADGKCILDIGNQRLIYPGKGAVEIKLPPGSVSYPFHYTSSGHLCQILNDYASLASAIGSDSEM